MRTFAPMMKTNTLDAMNHLYNTFLQVGKCALDLIASLPRSCPPHGKLRKLASGQQEVWRQLRRELVGGTDQRPVMWLHAASLGEYGVARPIARALHAQGRWRIVVTFFSPTGYEALKGKYAEEADHVFYLPLDTRAQACAFLDLVRPAKALFIISEFWPNYLAELKRRAVPTFLVSALISPKAPFFRWYGGVFRRALEAFTHFAVLNEASATRLGSLGHTNVTVTGDPLFDNAAAVAAAPWRDAVVERFAGGQCVFVAGSVEGRKDLDLVCTLANRHRDVRFLIVPHEISAENLRSLKYRLAGKACCYSECTEATDFAGVQTLIVDFVGALARLYRYGTWAYVGGGFTPRLHSVIEPVAYGLPVAFGPRTGRKVTPGEMERAGIGRTVRSAAELDRWFVQLAGHPARREQVRQAALAYTRRNIGATKEIMRIISEAQS